MTEKNEFFKHIFLLSKTKLFIDNQNFWVILLGVDIVRNLDAYVKLFLKSLISYQMVVCLFYNHVSTGDVLTVG